MSSKYGSHKRIARTTTSNTAESTDGVGADDDIDTDKEGVSPSDSAEEGEEVVKRRNLSTSALHPLWHHKTHRLPSVAEAVPISPTN